MNFKEQLNKAKELGINLLAVQIAYEVESFEYNGILSDEDFEKVCSIVKDYYLDIDDVSISNITSTVFSLINDGNSVEQIANMDRRDFIELIY